MIANKHIRSICTVTAISTLTRLLTSLILITPLSGLAEAAPAWFFKGQCKDSRVKRGDVSDDLRVQSGDPIHCDVAVLMILRNGRILLQFHTGTGVLGFAGPLLDRQTNKNNVAGIPVDKIYPIRDLGMTPQEIFKNSTRSEGVLDQGVEGICLLNNKDLKLVRNISCISKYEMDNKKTVYRVDINVTNVDKVNIPGL